MEIKNLKNLCICKKCGTVFDNTIEHDLIELKNKYKDYCYMCLNEENTQDKEYFENEDNHFYGR